jgi:hypothetical protein
VCGRFQILVSRLGMETSVHLYAVSKGITITTKSQSALYNLNRILTPAFVVMATPGPTVLYPLCCLTVLYCLYHCIVLHVSTALNLSSLSHCTVLPVSLYCTASLTALTFPACLTVPVSLYCTACLTALDLSSLPHCACFTVLYCLPHCTGPFQPASLCCISWRTQVALTASPF